MEETTRKALNQTISKDGNTSMGRRGWEQFDLNKMNYEQETKGALPFPGMSVRICQDLTCVWHRHDAYLAAAGGAGSDRGRLHVYHR